VPDGPFPRLERGDLPPRIVVPPPGPRSAELSRRLAATEAPGINTLGASAGAEPPTAVLVWEEALGANVLDVDGNRFLDLTAGFGVAAVGHRHPRVVRAAADQAGRLLHGLGDVAAHPTRVELAGRLCRLAPVRGAPDDVRVHFAVSGADAVEIALKTALLATGRPGVVAFQPSYHGVTLGALAATSRPAFRSPFAPHLHPHVHRLPYAAPVDRLTALAAETPLAAVLLEPVVGREGVIPPPSGWLPDLAAACTDHGILLVADEIFTGFGRTGDLFAVDHERVRPDLLCCGKALGGGLPIAATVGRADLMDAWAPRAGGVEALHTATHLANPPACAAALAVLELLRELDLPGRARRLGERVAARLHPWPDRFAAVREVRGRGLLWGVEFTSAADAKRIAVGLMDRGVLALAGGPDGNVLQVVPPLTITEEQLDLALDLLEGALSGA
jgi:4-aminobutyrate aminotransferase-like enzyme